VGTPGRGLAHLYTPSSGTTIAVTTKAANQMHETDRVRGIGRRGAFRHGGNGRYSAAPPRVWSAALWRVTCRMALTCRDERQRWTGTIGLRWYGPGRRDYCPRVTIGVPHSSRPGRRTLPQPALRGLRVVAPQVSLANPIDFMLHLTSYRGTAQSGMLGRSPACLGACAWG
jgi:hypothetical protein